MAEIASRQHGVASREQLLASGLSADAIGRMLRTGRLLALHRGVYAVGHTALTRRSHWQAGLLAAGGEAALGFRSATHLWDLLLTQPLPVEIVIPASGVRQKPNLIIHRSLLHPDEVMLVDGLRVTSPSRTVVDMATRLTARELRRMVERAQDLRRFHLPLIGDCIARRPRLPGMTALRDLLLLLAPDRDNARSYLERLFLALLRARKLQRPEVNFPIDGSERDFVWQSQRLVVEVDGHAFHSSPKARRRDARRDRRLISLGWRPVRFTYEEVAFEPGEVAREVADLLRV